MSWPWARAWPPMRRPARRGALALVPAPDTSLELADRLLNLGKEGRPAKAFLSIDDARKWLAVQPEA